MIKYYNDSLDYFANFMEQLSKDNKVKSYSEEKRNKIIDNEVKIIVETINDAKIICRNKVKPYNYVPKIDLSSLIDKYEFAKENKLISQKIIEIGEKEIVSKAIDLFILDIINVLIKKIGK